MTIDECILDCVHYTSTDICKYESIYWGEEQIKQITEWLEELKEYKKKPEGWMWDEAERKGYNKAIDDFIHECDKYCGFYRGDNKNKNITRKAMLSIAEQLKVGGNNETVL